MTGPTSDQSASRPKAPVLGQASTRPDPLPHLRPLIVNAIAATEEAQRQIDQSQKALVSLVQCLQRLEFEAGDGWPLDERAFGLAIRAARDKRNLTRLELSSIVGISTSTLQNVEFGKHRCQPAIRGFLIHALRAESGPPPEDEDKWPTELRAFGAAVKRARKRCKLTITELGHRVRITAPTIRSIEEGKSRCRGAIRREIIKILTAALARPVRTTD